MLGLKLNHVSKKGPWQPLLDILSWSRICKSSHCNSSFIHLVTICIEITLSNSFIEWVMNHDDVIKWKHFPLYCPFVRAIHLSPGNSPHAQRPVTRSFDVFFELRLNKRLSKQWWGWWFQTPSGPLWRHCNVFLLRSSTEVRCILGMMSSGISALLKFNRRQSYGLHVQCIYASLQLEINVIQVTQTWCRSNGECGPQIAHFIFIMLNNVTWLEFAVNKNVMCIL